VIGLPPQIPIYLYTTPTDMRKSFNGLCGIVTNQMGKRPDSSEAFVFVNRFCNRMKILLWDKGGFWLFYKRLEQGQFQLPVFSNHPSTNKPLSYNELLMIIEGVDFSSIKMKKRFVT